MLHAIGPRRVLIVDDDEDVRLAVQLGIALATDWEARLADHGDDALDCCLQWHPEAVVLDAERPGGDGFATLDVLRNHEATGHIPVVLLVAPSTSDVQIAAHADTVTGVLHKPLNLMAVGAQLAELLHWPTSN